jgi:spore germination cell wall hydrolase CwlJ-like protein
MLHSNKAILDEAARSVRRTFIGSVGGSLGMLVVVGAFGVYGMPERLTAQALTAAVTKLNVTFPHAAELVHPADRTMTLSVNEMPSEAAALPAPVKRNPVVMTIAEEPVVRAMPRVEPLAAMPAPVVSPVAPETPVAPPATVVAPSTPPDVVVALVASPAPQAAAPRETTIALVTPVAPAPAAPPPAIAIARPVAPAPAITSSVPPRAWVDGGDAPRIIPAPLVFEEPKLADIKPLQAMPEIAPVEPVAASPAPPAAMNVARPIETTPEPPAPKPMQQAMLAAPEAFEFPQTAMLPMPLAKPPLTPAQRLDLQGKEYDKAEKCLAQAIYFEARDEPQRGQMAVAQVVLNRVFSPYYPKDVCSVVYQNASHFLGCQFTFACDGKPESIREYGAWARANRIAKEALAAQIWLPDVAKATHYHAAYVRPRWIRDMRVMVRYGLHTFYRPRNWGDGSNEPAWGAGAKKSVKS